MYLINVITAQQLPRMSYQSHCNSAHYKKRYLNSTNFLLSVLYCYAMIAVTTVHISHFATNVLCSTLYDYATAFVKKRHSVHR